MTEIEEFEEKIEETEKDDSIIEETPIEPLPTVEGLQEVQPQAEEVEVSIEDCEMLYGVVMETAHSVVGTRKGAGHRELPEERRKAQGRLLYNICKKYNIKIPTEFEVVIFGGAIIADWQYMTVREGPKNTESKQIDIREEGGVRKDDTVAAEANHYSNEI
ncbi:MAG TPA: hypothetical protein VLM43_16575 [Desulfobacterales bacterium]|nr:hypothetical protein [Desulfobacterales bacterium]